MRSGAPGWPGRRARGRRRGPVAPARSDAAWPRVGLVPRAALRIRAGPGGRRPPTSCVPGFCVSWAACAGKRIYLYCSQHSHKRTNSACLMASYALLYLDRSPEEAWKPFADVYPPFPPFHDASPCVCTYNLTILDTLRGIDKARRAHFFDFDHFDIDEYERFEKVRAAGPARVDEEGK